MGDVRWVNVQPPTVDEAQRWLREHGAAFRQDTTDSLLDGNDVALHWAAKVLAALDHIEVLSAEIDSLRATLAAEKAEGARLLREWHRTHNADASLTGVDQTPLDEADKAWRCDICGLTGTSAALDQGGTANG